VGSNRWRPLSKWRAFTDGKPKGFRTGSKKSSSRGKEDIKVEFPSDSETNNLINENSLRLGRETLNPLNKEIDKEENCDGNDDDDDGMVDEGCFSCCEMKADFDCNNQVTQLDCGVPILLANNATTFSGDLSCVDLDEDGQIGMGDTLACLDIYNQGGGQ